MILKRILTIVSIPAMANVALGHLCGPPGVTLEVGQQTGWTITADVLEISTIYSPRLDPQGRFGDPAVAVMTPDVGFESQHGLFRIRAVGPGRTVFTVDWFNNQGPGGSGTCAVEVTVSGQPPVARCRTVVRETFWSCPVAVAPGEVNEGSHDPGGQSLTFSLQPPGPFFPGVTPVELTVTNQLGLSAKCGTNVEVLDGSSFPSEDLVLEADSECAYVGEIPVPRVPDPCAPGGSIAITHDAPPFLPLGMTAIVWKATDEFGRTVTLTQEVTVVDREPPTISCPSAATVEAGAGCGYAGPLETISVADNCTREGNFRIEYDAPPRLPLGDTAVRWKVVDESGNESVCDQVVTVVEAPVFRDCPGDLHVFCNGPAGAMVDFQVPQASCACSGLPVPVVPSHAPGTLFRPGWTRIVFEAIDDRGRRADCSFSVIVHCGEGGGQIPGDMNQDLVIDISDAISFLEFLFLGIPLAARCGGGPGSIPGFLLLADWNEDGGVDISDVVAMLLHLFQGGSGHFLGRGCTAIPGCPGNCAPAFSSRHPEPRILPVTGVFTGGPIHVEEAGGIIQDIQAVRLSYRSGVEMVEIGTDHGYDPDSTVHRGSWTFSWDISDLQPGSHGLLAEMFEVNGGYGLAEIEVVVALPPRGRVLLTGVADGMRWLSAESFGDADHLWTFDSGEALTGSLVAIPVSNDPRIFTHSAGNEWGAESDDLYLLDGASLYSWNGLEVPVALGEWERALMGIVDEKAALAERLSPSNRLRIEEANGKLRRAAEAIREAKARLDQVPPDTRGAKELLEEAARLIREARAVLENVDEERPAILENLRALDQLDGAGNLPLDAGGQRGARPPRAGVNVELDYLDRRQSELLGIIIEKKGLTGLNDQEKTIRDAIVALLEMAKPLLDEARNELLGRPRNLEAAERKIREARSKIKEAGEKINRFVPGNLRDNRTKLEALFTLLGFLEGRIWLHRQLGEDNRMVGNGEGAILLPGLSRDIESSNASFYRTSEETVHLHAGDGFSDDTIFHELDHHFQIKKGGDYSDGGNHGFDQDLRKEPMEREPNAAVRLAFSEGWADFSAAAKQGPPMFSGWNLDTLKRRVTEDGMEKEVEIRNRGPWVEASIAGLLWDLFDGGPAGDDDRVQVPFPLIWKALCPRVDSPTRTIGDFRRRLIGILGENGYTDRQMDAVNDLFKSHGVFSDSGN